MKRGGKSVPSFSSNLPCTGEAMETSPDRVAQLQSPECPSLPNNQHVNALV